MRTSVGRPRWMSPSTPSTACWSSDARATSAPPDPRRGRGQCARTPDPCTTLARTGGHRAVPLLRGRPGNSLGRGSTRRQRPTLARRGGDGASERQRRLEMQPVDCVRMVHCRRHFYEIHRATGSPLAEEALRRIGELYRIEAEVRGRPAEERRAVRQERSKPLVDALHAWLTVQLGRVSGKSGLAEAIRYALRHWQGLVLFLDDGRLEPDTDVIERAIRPIALGRKNSLFAGSDGGARWWAVVASLVATAKLNGVEPLAWLTDVLERVVSGRTKAHELERLLPWVWQAERLPAAGHS